MISSTFMRNVQETLVTYFTHSNTRWYLHWPILKFRCISFLSCGEIGTSVDLLEINVSNLLGGTGSQKGQVSLLSSSVALWNWIVYKCKPMKKKKTLVDKPIKLCARTRIIQFNWKLISTGVPEPIWARIRSSRIDQHLFIDDITNCRVSS